MTKDDVERKLKILGSWQKREEYLIYQIAEIEAEKYKIKGRKDLAEHLAKIEEKLEIINQELEQSIPEMAEIKAALAVIPEPMSKLLRMRYIERKEWFKVAMEIDYSEAYVRKELKDKALQMVADLIDGIL